MQQSQSCEWICQLQYIGARGIYFWTFVCFMLEFGANYLTQLNSTSHLQRWLTRGKKLKGLNHVPSSLKKQSSRFLNVDNILQCNNISDELFHSSITLTLKKFFLISKWAWGLYSLYLWPLSPVLDIVKKAIGLTPSRPLKILNSSIKPPRSQ